MRAAIPPPGSEFLTFLYAPISSDDEGMNLSVLSALARQDFEPWTEAARLAELPREQAVKEMIKFLDALPTRTSAHFDRVEVAGRLCALLPRPSSLNSSELFSHRSTAEKSPMTAFTVNWQFLTIYIFLLLLMNWLIGEFHARPSAPTSSGNPPAQVVEQAPNPNQ